jgi:hypothetical protein
VMGRPISGSLTPPSAVVTCSGVGSGELMPSCYAADKRDGLLPSRRLAAVGRAGAQELTR